MDKTYNNYSPQLRAYFKGFTPKDPLIFRLMNLRTDPITKKLIVPQSSSVDPIDRIVDPWGIDTGQKDDNGKAIYQPTTIDIAYITGNRPAPANSVRESKISLGEIIFRRENMGMIQYDGLERTLEAMAMFLFFCNRNQTNQGKPWHVAPRFGYIYYVHSKSEEATTQYKASRNIDKANDVIESLQGDAFDRIKRGMFPSEHNLISDDEVRNRLRVIATKSPEKILGLSKDVDVNMNAFITEMESAGLLLYEESTKQWLWPDTKAMLCIVKPGQTKISALKTFFLTSDGGATAELLESQLKAKKEGVGADPGKTS